MPELDSPWKEALDDFLQPFLAFFALGIEKRIDWDFAPESLDNELAKLFPDAADGKRFVDRLYKVRLRDGTERWVLIHLEVQGQRDDDFPERLFRYFYRLWDKFGMQITCIAVLADESPSWKPRAFVYEFEETRVEFTFPVVKLADYRDKIEELERAENIFALIVLAHLQSQRVKENENRLDWKRRITHNLLARPLDEERRAKVLRLLDWLIDIPVELNQVYWTEVRAWKERNIMPFVSGLERIAKEEGREEGKREELVTWLGRIVDFRFGASGQTVVDELKAVNDLAKLREVQAAIFTAQCPDDLRRILVNP